MSRGIAVVLLLLSPAQYPWYIAWVLPFMVLHPVTGILLAAALMPLYYLSFYFRTLGAEWIFDKIFVFAIWLPVWACLAFDARRAWRENRLRPSGETF